VSAPSLVEVLEAVDSFKILEAGFFGGTPYCHTGDKTLSDIPLFDRGPHVENECSSLLLILGQS